MSSHRAVCHALILLTVTLVALPTTGRAQIPTRHTKSAAQAAMLRSLRPRTVPITRAHAALFTASPTATVTESEPNDSIAVANVVTLGDTVGGAIDPAGDGDVFALDIAAGTTIALDVIAERAGSPLDPVLLLVGTDSATVLVFNDDFNGLDSYIEYTVAATGRYFAVLQGFDTLAGPGYTYALATAVLPPGPGDPTTLYGTDLGAPYGMAAGASGELYVVDADSSRLLRVAPNGQVTVVDSFPGAYPIGVALDGLGDVLVSTVDTSFAAGHIVRFRGAQRSTFATVPSAAAITIGPDADVWMIDPESRLLRRFDPLGTAKGTASLASLSVLAYEANLAFSPAGDLYLTNGYDVIYKMVSGVPQPVYQANPYLEGLAFDTDGYVYVANGFVGRVILLDPSFQVVDDPFARSNVGGPTQVVFLRDGAGAMTSRLLADNVGYKLAPPYYGGAVEMNPAGMRAVGFRIGIDLLPIATASLKSGVVGTDYADTLRLVSPPGGAATWSVSAGVTPPGLTLASDGRLTGVPTQAGAFSFTVRVDAASQFGVKAFTVTVTSPSVSVDAASQHLLGGTPLSLDLQNFLDLQGNHNGHYDVGDFRAFLRANGQLPATAVARKERP